MFKDSNDAFEKRGFANFASMIRETIEQIYRTTRSGVDEKQDVPQTIDGESKPITVGVSNGRRENSDFAY